MSERIFTRGTDRIDRLVASADPVAQAALDAEARDNDRVYAMSLALIREAGQQTQAELAANLHKSQGAVSQLETRSDMLLSTLRTYLVAAGANDPRVVVTINGHDVQVDLPAMPAT